MTLLEDLLLPHLGPRFWGMAEHFPASDWSFAFRWHSPMRTKYYRAGTGIEQCRQTFSKLELLLFTKEVEERGGVDGGDASS